MRLRKIKKNIHDIRQLISKGYVVNDFVREALQIHPPPCIKEQFFLVQTPNNRMLKFTCYEHMPLLYTIGEVIEGRVYEKYFDNIDRDLRSSVVIDVGACIGVFSIFVSAVHLCKAYALEMDSSNFSLLEKNIALNNDNCDVVCHNKAITSQNGIVKYIHGYDMVGSRVVDKHIMNEEFRTITSTTLKNFLDSEGIRNVGLLKMDCEGSEYEIIIGLENSVLERIEKISFEYHLTKPDSKILLKKTLSRLKRFYNDVHIEHDEIRGNLGMVWAQ